MQTQTGQGTNTTASVTNGSNIVNAAAGSDWNQVTTGSRFTVRGSFAIYQVLTCALVSGTWRITLNVNYAGTTNAAVSYTIQTHFGTHGEPIFANGDTEFYPLINDWTASLGEAMSIIANTFANARPSPTTDNLQLFFPSSLGGDNKYRDLIGLLGTDGLPRFTFGAPET